MSNHEEDKLFKYATKEDGFSFINLIEEINWDIRKYDFKSENLTFNPTELIELDPALAAIIVTPLTQSITTGIIAGVFAFVIVKVLFGKAKEISKAMWILFALLFIYMVLEFIM